MNLHADNLKNCFENAKLGGYKYIGILVQMKDFPSDEIIINRRDNFDKKLEYYLKTYDENLKHKYSEGISIVGFTYGDSFGEIYEDLL